MARNNLLHFRTCALLVVCAVLVCVIILPVHELKLPMQFYSCMRKGNGPEPAGDATAKYISAPYAASRYAAARDATAKYISAPYAASRDAAARDATSRYATARDATARDAKARDAKARDATARDAKARYATARDATARDATARDATVRDATEKDTTVVVCTQQQRLEQIARMCDRYEGTHATRASTISTVDSMTDKQILKLARIWFVVPELQTMGCLNWKTGSMTWRNVLKWNKEIQEAGIVYSHLTEYPIPEIRKMFKTYWKFMTIRHPLSRLVSAYKDKVLGKDSYAAALDRTIIQFIRGRNATVDSMARGSTFLEFLHYINENGTDLIGKDDGGHWHSLLSRCQPCAINFDHVVRTETFAEDAPYIIDHRLRGRGHGAKLHVVHDTNPRDMRSWEVVLDEYQEIPTDLLIAMGKRYEKDMAVYGYNYTRLAGRQVRAECATLTNKGHTCC